MQMRAHLRLRPPSRSLSLSHSVPTHLPLARISVDAGGEVGVDDPECIVAMLLHVALIVPTARLRHDSAAGVGGGCGAGVAADVVALKFNSKFLHGTQAVG